VDLSAIAHSIANELRQTQPKRQVVFSIAEDIYARCDAPLIRSVLENLFSNAWKYTSKHAAARIEFGSILHPDGNTAYFVRDDGAGFDMAYAKNLFGAFQRLHSEKVFPGIGIGLATVQRIINRHNGHVWAESIAESGTTFYFTLGKG
jgi:light-regulated signal transduction histidine kinase (bacteriophytochrome)